MPKLERAAYVCIIGVCVVTVGLRLERRFRPLPAPALVSDASPAVLNGRRLEIEGVHWASSGLTAVLFINSHCHFCVDSAPFYREVADMHRRHRNGLTVAALSIDAPQLTRDFLSKERVVVDAIYQMSVPVKGLSGTPTLLILDGHGIVQRVFTGVLDQTRQQEFLNIIERDSL